MFPREEGVAVEHPGAGVAHHRTDLLPHGRFVAVDGACGALRLVVTEGAFFKTPGRVVEKLPALRAEVFLRTVVTMAEDPDHRLDGSAFGLKGCAVIGHGGMSCDALKDFTLRAL